MSIDNPDQCYNKFNKYETTRKRMNKTGNNFHPITLEVDNDNLTDKKGSQDSQKRRE